MSVNRGKQFEDVVRDCLEKSGAYVLRLYDPQGGYVAVANPCDFVVWKDGQMYMLECKAIHGNLLSIHSNDPKRKYGLISNTQWQGLSEALEKSVVAGVLVWWIDKDITKFIPIDDLEAKRWAGNKSVRYDYPVGYEIAGTKKRVFFDYDFTDFFRDCGGLKTFLQKS